MSHEKNLEPGTCATPQPGCCFTKEQSIYVRGGGSPDETIQYFQEASLPICSRGPTDWKTDSDSGSKNSFYGQDFPESDSFTSSVCQIYGQDTERSCYTGTGNFSAKRSGAWLRGKKSSEISSWNTALIDYQRRRSFKHIVFWSPRKFGKWEIQKN